MTRIDAVAPDEAGPLIRMVYWWTKRAFGEVPAPLAVTANHRKLFIAQALHTAATQRAATVLPANVRNPAEYRAVSRVGCSWCMDFGAMIHRLEGLDVDQLTQIGDYATSSAYSDDERAAIAYADAMTTTPPKVTAEQVADLQRRFGRPGVVELTYLIAWENLQSRMNAALGITDQGFSSGGACRVPWADGTAQATT